LPFFWVAHYWSANQKKIHQNAHKGHKPRLCWCGSWQKHKEGLGAWGLVDELTAGMGWLF
jgi:hypothetical protein